MAMTVSLKEKLKASFDLVFLFGQGIKPFEKDPSREAGLKSLWVLVVLFPFNLASAWLWPPADLNTLPKGQVILTELGETVVQLPLSILLMWLAAIALDRRDRFWIVFQAGNWINIPLSVISAPFIALGLMEWHSHEVMDRVFTVFTYYSFIVSACVYYRGYKTNWELAAFIACFGIAIGQLVQNCADWLNGVPIR
jgi:hypothetical protein